MKFVRGFCEGVNAISAWTAKVAQWIVLVIVLVIGYDVAARYLFNTATTWSWTLCYMLGASLIALGLPWVLSTNNHIRVDIIYNKFPVRVRGLIEVTLTLLFFFPLVFVLSHSLINSAVQAYQTGNFDYATMWRAPLWPYKSVVAFGFALLLLQGIANFVKDVLTLWKGGKPW